MKNYNYEGEGEGTENFPQINPISNSNRNAKRNLFRELTEMR